MVGPLKKSSKGGRTHLLVAVDKFTKWIEAVPITSSIALTAVNCIKSIIFRFGVPHNIIMDNGTNFTAVEYQNFCEELGIKINYASVAHQRPGGKSKRPCLRGNQETAPRTTRESRKQLGRRAPRGPMEPTYYTKHSEPVHTLIHGVRG